MIDMCLSSVDETDFQIREPTPFSSEYFSNKFRGPGLRYKVAVSIHHGNIIWIYGPFSCGSWPDLKIFQNNLSAVLNGIERVVADKDKTITSVSNQIMYASRERYTSPHTSISCDLKPPPENF